MISLYPKLAWQNIRNNKNTFIPFALASITLIMMLYILSSMTGSMKDDAFRGAYFVKDMLQIGIWVIRIMTVIVMFYINSFLMKQRTKEFGLYSVLGMEKKHISRTLFFETLIVAVFSLIVGLGAGLLFGKLAYLLLLNIVGMDVRIPYVISWSELLNTAIFFLVIYLVLVLWNALRIKMLKTIEMLHSNKKGEREPKLRIITTLLGFLALGGGYYLAISTKDAALAVGYFFLAVLLVIVGTYLLFMSGSIAILKILKKNKKYYYHKTHFITVSGMMYRMKQNAVGLATICILSTMVLVTISTTLSLYIGINTEVNRLYPYEAQIYADDTTALAADENYEAHYDMAIVRKTAVETADELGIEMQNVIEFRNFELAVNVEDQLTNLYTNSDHGSMLEAYTLEDYQKLLGSNAQSLAPLQDGEVYLFTTDAYIAEKVTKLLGDNQITVYTYMTEPEKGLIDQTSSRMTLTNVLILAKDAEGLQQVSTSLPRINSSGEAMTYAVDYCYAFDMKGSRLAKGEYLETLENNLAEREFWGFYMANTRESGRLEALQMYGSLFFIGIVLGTLFLLTTVLIIYYKQITEGYDDRKRFLIMENVGMSKHEVKKVIRNQILTVFFMPILVATIHIIFAFSMIKLILLLIGLSNVQLFIMSTIATVLVFAVIYAIVYGLTAKAYYRIVNTADAKA